MKTTFKPTDMLELTHETAQEQKEHSEEVKRLTQVTQDEVDAYFDERDLVHHITEYQEKLEKRPLSTLIKMWLNSRSWTPETRKNYEHYITDMQQRDIIPERNPKGEPLTLLDFALLDHKARIAFMRQIPEWSTSTQELRIGCYASFTNFLNNVSYGLFRKVVVEPSSVSALHRADNARSIKALTLPEWQQFISALHNLGERDSLIARFLLHDITITPVLNLQLPQVNFDTGEVRFSKVTDIKGGCKTTPVTYPLPFIEELKKYIRSTADIRGDSMQVFITRTGRRIARSRCNYSFSKASKAARIKHVTPYTIRATYVTLVKGGGIDSSALLQIPDIQKKMR